MQVPQQPLGWSFRLSDPWGEKCLLPEETRSYPISKDVQTTLDRTVIADPPATHLHSGPNASIYPCQISLYTQNEYGEWVQNPEGIPAGPESPYCAIDMNSGLVTSPSVPDPSATTLLSFFTMSDVHICDKESPAQSIYNAYQYPNPLLPRQQHTCRWYFELFRDYTLYDPCSRCRYPDNQRLA